MEMLRRLHGGAKEAILAGAASILIALWHMLEHDVDYRNLGCDVTLTPEAAGKR